MSRREMNVHLRVGRWLGRLAWLAAGFAVAFLLVVDPLDLHPLNERMRGGGSEPAGQETAGELELWTCPMHPHILEEEPGLCPVCNMDLVPLKSVEAVEVPGGTTVGSGTTIRIDPVVVQNMNVQTAPVERRDLRHHIRTVGYLEYDQERMVTVTTKYPGWVEKVYVNYLGEAVRKGQSLFEIYSPELVQTEQELLSALEYARRLEGASEEAHGRAQALVEAVRARLRFWDISSDQVDRLEQSGQVFRTLQVTAPAGGLIMKRMEGLEGMAVRPGMEIFHIADLSTLWLSVELFEDQIAWVRRGTEGQVSFSYFPGETFQAAVRFIEPEFSEKTRTLKVKLAVPNRDGRLRAGMFATVLFEPVAAEQALAVPSQAVLRTGERNVVVVDRGDGRFEPREVVLGREGEGFVAVLEGVDEGERVVTSAQFLLDSEASLQEAVRKMIARRAGLEGN